VLSYIILGAADAVLMLRYARHGMARAEAEAAEPPGGVAPALTY
jgi:hypothetical protein